MSPNLYSLAITHFMELDCVLIQQVEELADGQTVHLHANLAGAYQTAIEEFNRTGDDAYRLIAEEAQTGLRVLLARLRLQRGAYLVRWE